MRKLMGSDPLRPPLKILFIGVLQRKSSEVQNHYLRFPGRLASDQNVANETRVVLFTVHTTHTILICFSNSNSWSKCPVCSFAQI